MLIDMNETGEKIKHGRKREVLFAVAFFSWIILIFIFSSIPGSSTPALPNGTDKIVHFLEYTILGILAIQTFKVKSIVVWLPGFLIPVLDEFYQSFTPGRYADVYDVIADILGYMTVLFFYRFRFQSKTTKEY